MFLIPQKVDKVIDFCLKLPDEGSTEWADEKGRYEIVLGNKSLNSNMAGNGYREIFMSETIQKYLRHQKHRFKHVIDSTGVLSIGTFEAHNKAKIFCESQKFDLTTVPFPLSNDSFGTNRISLSERPSVEGNYPSKTIFDYDLIRKQSIKSSILGIGEFIGLYTSTIDFYSVRLKEPPDNMLRFICDIANRFDDAAKEDPPKFIHLLALALLFKVLVMRIHPDYQVGCGTDHIIARYFEKTFQMPHGRAVYLGMLLSLLLFPDWEHFGLGFSKLELLGLEIGLISPNDLDRVTALDISELLRSACQMRRDRPTNINPCNFNIAEIKNFKKRLSRYRESKQWETLN